MKKNYAFFLMMLLSILITACSKDGLEGPEGPAGAAGAVGPSGQDGSIMYSGSAAPVATLGKPGDYYLNRTSGQLYGPKTATDWGTPIMLIGASGTNGTNGANGAPGAPGTNGTNGTNGAAGTPGGNGTNGTNGTNGINGTNGSTQLSGTGTPALTLGANGDYYLDKTNYLLYGPKTAAGWGVAILLRGADGAQGPVGPAGADGTVIYGGDYSPAPNLGKVGDYFIGRYTVMLYGPKTTSGWGAGINLKGTDGTNGSSVLNGIGVPANTTGVDGDFYIDLSTYTIYGPKSNTAWGAGTSLKGADGNASVVALETADTDFFQWSFQSGTTDQFLRRYGSVLPNDTTSIFNIPAANFAAAKQGVVLVYLRKNVEPGVSSWQQLNYTEAQTGVGYRYNLRLTATNASLRISFTPPASAAPYYALMVDKVRIVIVPQSSTGVLSVHNQSPLLQTMQKLNLEDKDFIKLK